MLAKPTIKSHISLRWLTVAVIVTATAVSWFALSAYQSYRNAAAIDTKLFRLIDLQGTFLYLDEALTMSAHMAAVTGDLGWERRYRSFEPKLNAALGEVTEMGLGANINTAADLANAKLVAMENRAFSLVGRHRLKEAQAILVSETYKEQKHIYAHGIALFSTHLHNLIDAERQLDRQENLGRLVIALCVIPLIILGWLCSLQTMLQSQVTLRESGLQLEGKINALAELNATLDQKTRESEASRIAALNMMEDATESKGKAEALNQELRQEITERRRAEDAWRMSEERYRSLALATAQVVWTTNAQGEVVEDLPTWREYTGQSVQDISGLGWIQAVHPDDQKHTTNAWLGAVKEATAYQVECRMRAADGKYRIFTDRGVPVLDGNGQIREWVGTCTDITESKEAEASLRQMHDELEVRVQQRTAELEQVNVALQGKEAEQKQIMATLAQSEERFRLLVESVHDYAILMLDTTGHVMTWNAGAEYLKGYRAEEIIGRHFSCFYTEEDRQAGRPENELHIAASQGYFDDEGWRVRQDGSQFWATVVITALRDDSGQLRGYAKITRDITERKNIEAALREAKAQADAANQAKSEFLSRMSHELRTPLNAILGFGQLLAKQDFAPAQQERVQHILKAGRHLLDLINEVLEIARIEAGHMVLSLEPVHVHEIVEEVFSLLKPLAAEHDIQLRRSDRCEMEVHVRADRQRLKQVLLNLCSNAIKYNRPKGSINITCQTIPGILPPEGPSTGDQLRINVTDTGIGITSAAQAQLFVPFMRVGAEQTTIEGTGLGLALSLGLMHAMDGTIGVESTVGVGSTFWLQLPLVPSPKVLVKDALDHEHALSDATPSLVSATRYTLLYIEDNLSNLQLIEAIIADQPAYELISAMQGQMGLDLARQHHPDLILLDLNLPDVPGDKILARLKAEPATADTPVVMLSAVAMESEIKRLLAGGAVAYLTKPLDIYKFLETLSTILQPTERRL